MCGLGVWELLIVLAIVLVIFGASRLPQIGKALGETVRNFKKGVGDGQQSVADGKRESIEVHEVDRLEGSSSAESDSKGPKQS
jgi:sec-independent protein translocase protein TatA